MLTATGEVKPKRVITKLCAQAAKAHVKAWRESGMSLPDYCHQHGIAKSTFYGWVERYERKAASGFSAVVPERVSPKVTQPPLVSQTPKQAIDVILPNGIHFHLSDIKHSSQVTQFIKGFL